MVVIDNEIKKLLKDHVEDLKNNNLDSVFKDLYSAYQI